jgi:23S rRNA (cytidine1920-2'-O)/16S rRNA (cytidine1409-2'-O)-methyltransferase
MTKRRIDLLLVEKGLVESQTKAQALVMAGEVMVDGKPVLKAGTLVSEKAILSLTTPPPFVSRGGIKLEYALEEFGVDVSGMVVADIGASTGGFTDCLLKQGASRVYAVDVGKGQLDWRLRNDARVVVMEGLNARYGLDIPEKSDLITIDVSFISVEKVILPVMSVLKKSGSIIVLIKPQYEAQKREVGRGGVIIDPEVHARVLGRFIHWVSKEGLRLHGLIASPISGASGNREFFVFLGLPG